MFDLGLQELVVIFVVALLVFGPKRLPELAKTMGKGIGQLRKAMLDVKAEVEKEMEESEPGIKHDLPDWKKVPEEDRERPRDPYREEPGESPPESSPSPEAENGQSVEKNRESVEGK